MDRGCSRKSSGEFYNLVFKKKFQLNAPLNVLKTHVILRFIMCRLPLLRFSAVLAVDVPSICEKPELDPQILQRRNAR